MLFRAATLPKFKYAALRTRPERDIAASGFETTSWPKPAVKMCEDRVSIPSEDSTKVFVIIERL